MKIIHTSDWHIGRNLYNKKRYIEHQKFLDWLTEYIISNEIDTLLVSGDIFDTGTPSNRAQNIYYEFLCKTSQTCCKNIIITGGNHDSPSFLNAPKKILKNMNIHIIGSITESEEEEIITIKDNDNEIKAIICAIPYLRERDIRKSLFGESDSDKMQNTLKGIENHYKKVIDKAVSIKKFQNNEIPIIVMGHLFTAGGKVVDGDGVRELYVGSLNKISTSQFPSSIDYLALGHLHSSQKVNNLDHFRYSGSPIKMSFSEADQTKYIIQLNIKNGKINTIENVEVPEFQKIQSIKGNLEKIKIEIEKLKNFNTSIWLEIIYDSSVIHGNLQKLIYDLVEDSSLEILRVKNLNILNKIILQQNQEIDLKSISEIEVFDKCLDYNNVDDSQKSDLRGMFQEVLQSINDEDENQE